jgi:hypothetical protein
VAKAFLEQPGVPVLSFEKRCGKSPKVVVRQKADVPVGAASVTRVWTLPLCAGEGKGRVCAIVDEAETTLEGPLAQAICRGGVDAGASLYAHVDPTADDAKPSRLAKLTGRERAARLLDAWALVRRDPKQLPLFLQMLEAVDAYVDRATTSARLEVIGELEEKIAKHGDEAFEAYATARLAQAMKALDRGRVSDGALMQTKTAWMTAERVSGGKIRMADEGKLAASYLEGRAGKLADKGAAAVELSMRGAGKAEVAERLAKLEAGVAPDRRPAVVRSLFAASSGEIFDGALEYVLSEKFRLQDARFVFAAAYANGKQRLHFVDWVDGHFDALTKKFPDRLAVYFVDPIGWVCDAPTLERLEANYTPRVAKLPEAQRSFEQAREGARRCIALRSAAAPFATFKPTR